MNFCTMCGDTITDYRTRRDTGLRDLKLYCSPTCERHAKEEGEPAPTVGMKNED
ncbi:hypothetical protein ES707_10318 [subsurface metagenome]